MTGYVFGYMLFETSKRFYKQIYKALPDSRKLEYESLIINDLVFLPIYYSTNLISSLSSNTIIMVGFTILAVLSAIAATLASPVKREAELEPFVFRRNNSTGLVRRGSPNYNQDYVAGGDVIFTPSGSGTFEVQWSCPSSADDFVVGRGWTSGGIR